MIKKPKIFLNFKILLNNQKALFVFEVGLLHLEKINFLKDRFDFPLVKILSSLFDSSIFVVKFSLFIFCLI